MVTEGLQQGFGQTSCKKAFSDTPSLTAPPISARNDLDLKASDLKAAENARNCRKDERRAFFFVV